MQYPSHRVYVTHLCFLNQVLVIAKGSQTCDYHQKQKERHSKGQQERAKEDSEHATLERKVKHKPSQQRMCVHQIVQKEPMAVLQA